MGLFLLKSLKTEPKCIVNIHSVDVIYKSFIML